MKVINLSLENNNRLKKQLACCIGFFDGIHLGHRKLIESTLELAESEKLKKGLISFNVDPSDIIKNVKTKHIHNYDIRIKQLEEYGLDYYIIIDFSKQMMEMSYQEFHVFLKNRLDIKHLVCGFDYHYGYKGLGNCKTLKEVFNTHVLESVNFLGDKISSTRIKKELLNCDISLVNKLLGYDYFVDAKVIDGLKIGRKIGFPTANMKVDENLLYPGNGVYLGYLFYEEKKYFCLINIGNNPTVNNDDKIRIEVHILEFENNIYDKELRIYFLDFLREEIKFENLDLLKKQLEKDVLTLKKYAK